MTAQNQNYRVQVPVSPVPPDMTVLALHASKGFKLKFNLLLSSCIGRSCSQMQMQRSSELLSCRYFA